MDFPLAKPVTVGGRVITSLTLRPPTWGDQIDIEGSPDALLALLARVTGETPEVVGALYARDARALVAYIDNQAPIAVPDGDDLVLELPEPVTVGGATTTSIRLREPVLRDVLRAQKGARGNRPLMYALLATYVNGTEDATEAKLRRCPRTVYHAAAEFFDRFLEGASSSTSSPTLPATSDGDRATTSTSA